MGSDARALVVTHAESVPLGTLADWLPAAGMRLDLVEPWAGDTMPDRMTSHHALVIMGGPQQAFDDDSARWLRATKSLIAKAVEDGVPVLGICLGAQLLAEATGGKVQPGSRGPEFGATSLSRTSATRADALFGELPAPTAAVQWHWDAVVRLPIGARVLLSGECYEYRAFRVGRSAYGIQCHVETTPKILRAWAAADAERVRAAGLDPKVVTAQAIAVLPAVEAAWRPVIERFVRAAMDGHEAPLPGVRA